jgi:5-methylcytosine-specific restriction endonuclease McrA
MSSEAFGSLLAENAPRTASEALGEDVSKCASLPNLAEDAPAVKVTPRAERERAARAGRSAAAIVVKVCATCQDPKPLESFHRHKSHAFGRDTRCKACKSARRAERYRSDPEAAHASSRAWKKNNPVRARVHRLRRDARDKTGESGDLTADEWEEIVGSYRETFTDAHGVTARGRYRCAYCARRMARVNLTIDHVVALSRGGRNTRSNVVPACLSCNSSKSDRDRWPILDSPHLGCDAIDPVSVSDDALRFP